MHMLHQLQALYHRLCPRIEVTKQLYDLRCRININDHLMWLAYPQTYTIENPSRELMSRRWGKVWDVGCNFGFYSMVAARAGNECFAFDMSPRALRLLSESCRINGLQVTAIPRAITATPSTYVVPRTSACTNSLVEASGVEISLTYLDAAKQYGTPSFIKMDIEGGERRFIESMPFQEWIVRNGITLLVELHHGYRPDTHAFAGMNRAELGLAHILFSPC